MARRGQDSHLGKTLPPKHISKSELQSRAQAPLPASLPTRPKKGHLVQQNLGFEKKRKRLERTLKTKIFRKVLWPYLESEEMQVLPSRDYFWLTHRKLRARG